MVGAKAPQLLEQVTGMATPHSSSIRSVMRRQQLLDDLMLIGASGFHRVQLKKLVKLLFAGIADFDFVWNPSQERFVNKLGWLQVRREQDQLFERHLEFLS